MELTEIKSLVETGNKQIAAVQEAIESKADAATVARIQADLAATLSEKSALEARLTAIETAAARVAISGKSVQAADEAKSAFVDYLRKPTEANRAAYEMLAVKSINTAAPADGGVAMHPTIGAEVLKIATNLSPIRQIARVIQVSNPAYTETVAGKAASGWVGETGVRAETAAPAFSKVEPKFGELNANVLVSNHSLNDLFFDVEAFVTERVAEQFAEQEGVAFVSGTGVAMPMGFAAAAAGVTAVNSGNATTFGADVFGTMCNALFGLKTAYRNNAAWVMNSLTLASLANVKDSTGRPLLQTALTAGAPLVIHGKPVYIEEGVASVAANALPIFVADWKKAYVIADVAGESLITDNVTNKGYTSFYVSKRLGASVALNEAIKAVKIAA